MAILDSTPFRSAQGVIKPNCRTEPFGVAQDRVVLICFNANGQQQHHDEPVEAYSSSKGLLDKLVLYSFDLLQ